MWPALITATRPKLVRISACLQHLPAASNCRHPRQRPRTHSGRPSNAPPLHPRVSAPSVEIIMDLCMTLSESVDRGGGGGAFINSSPSGRVGRNLGTGKYRALPPADSEESQSPQCNDEVF
eukprot:GHVU01033498.1.p2 GENE.GHVU01033498.1~~GHVU01033498.1.p2  ORF type:complete len:121 (-),score=6.58 GHVU01033498.1:442-804(-)